LTKEKLEKAKKWFNHELRQKLIDEESKNIFELLKNDIAGISTPILSIMMITQKLFEIPLKNHN